MPNTWHPLWFGSVHKRRSGKWATRSLARSLRGAHLLSLSLAPQCSTSLRSLAPSCAPLTRSLRSLARSTRGKVSPYERVTSVSRTDLANENASILTDSSHSGTTSSYSRTCANPNLDLPDGQRLFLPCTSLTCQISGTESVQME